MFNSQDWKIKKEHEFGRGFVKIWLYRELGNSYEVAHFGSNGEMTAEEVKGGSVEVAPTMILPAMGWDRLIESFKNQETTYHEKEVDAELKATKLHLQDMRDLVFFDKLEKKSV